MAPTFDEAVKFIKSAKSSTGKTPSNDQRLRLYGLYKQVTTGDVKGTAPWAVNIEKRAKFDAHAGHKGMLRADAEAAYSREVVKQMKQLSLRNPAMPDFPAQDPEVVASPRPPAQTTDASSEVTAPPKRRMPVPPLTAPAPVVPAPSADGPRPRAPTGSSATRDALVCAFGAYAMGTVGGLRGWRRVLAALLGGGAAALFTRRLVGLRRDPFPLEAWLSSGEAEEALEPELPIIDPHHHLWDVRTQPKGWPLSAWALKFLYSLRPALIVATLNANLKKETPSVLRTFSAFNPFAQPYMAEELARDIAQHRVEKTVYIECGWKDPVEAAPAMRAVGEAVPVEFSS